MARQLGTIDTICACYDQLPDMERRVADFILQNRADVPHLSVRDIAKDSQTSGATVSRFVRHAGFDSFASMRLAIASEQAAGDDSVAEAATEISPRNIVGSLEYILETKVQELRSTVSQISADALERALDLIRACDTLCFAAVGNSIPVCANLAFKLGQIGRRAVCPTTTESMILASLSLRRTDVLFVVSASGYSRRLETIIDNAEDSDTPIVFVTSNPSSSLAARADVVLPVASRDQLLAGGQFSSHVSPDFLVEALFLLLYASADDAREHARMERKSLGRDKESTPTLN